MKLFSSVLIANRGEIACRIISTAKKLNIKTIAIFSEEDRNSLHSNLADEAICIGSSKSKDSYLNVKKILEIAKKYKVESIHPGYGFLSENYIFAKAVEDSGITFIGPNSKTIKLMGLKDHAIKKVKALGIPTLPGYHELNQTENNLINASKKIGFPLMIKARAGGGGRGMRKVNSFSEFPTLLKTTINESKISFKDKNIILEKFISNPRHIEVQILSDKFGNYFHLFERECSLQRRNQKIIEEAPCPNISSNFREKIINCALKIIKELKYEGAGTIEFIADGSKGLKENCFWFLEMNTRLQVEHTVTELITGLDIVKLQFLIASGNKIPFKQDDIVINGHAIQARVFAEDTQNNFIPTTGKIEYLSYDYLEDRKDIHIRIDNGYKELSRISQYYDGMISKIISHAQNRTLSLNGLKTSLFNSHIIGIKTNLNLLSSLCNNKIVKKGEIFTDFIEKNLSQFVKKKKNINNELIIASLVSCRNTLYKENFVWRLWGEKVLRFVFYVNGREIYIKMEIMENNEFLFLINEKSFKVKNFYFKSNNKKLLCEAIINNKKNVLSVLILNKGFSINSEHNNLFISNEIEDLTCIEKNNDLIISPITATVQKIFITPKSKVKKNDCVLILEAMKMELEIKATKDGIVNNIFCKEGDIIQLNQKIMDFAKN